MQEYNLHSLFLASSFLKETHRNGKRSRTVQELIHKHGSKNNSYALYTLVRTMQGHPDAKLQIKQKFTFHTLINQVVNVTV